MLEQGVSLASGVTLAGTVHVGAGAYLGGEVVYLLTNFGGRLYAFDVEDELLRDLGSLFPDDEVAETEIAFVNGLILSKNERKLYSLPCMFRGGGTPTLHEYDIETGQRSRLARFPSLNGGTVTGNAVIDDQGRLYFGYHAGTDEGQRAQLIQIYRKDP